jgi:hypothetical protein
MTDQFIAALGFHKLIAVGADWLGTTAACGTTRATGTGFTCGIMKGFLQSGQSTWRPDNVESLERDWLQDGQ